MKTAMYRRAFLRVARLRGVVLRRACVIWQTPPITFASHPSASYQQFSEVQTRKFNA
jgi:hypothetical protein